MTTCRLPIGILIACLVVGLGACAGNERAASVDSGAGGQPRTVYVLRRGWHVDVGFPAAEIQGPLAATLPALPGARVVLYGFGDRRYLMTRDENTCTGLAALWPGAGLILVTGLATTPDLAFSEKQVVRIVVTGGEALALENFVWGAIAADPAGVKPLASGPYDGSVYFASSTRYSGVHTCNTWAADALHAAGLPVTSRGVVFAGQVFRQARRCALPRGAAPDALSACAGT